MPTKERGLIMSHEMNLALRADKKTVTRRISGLQEVNQTPDDWEFLGISKLPNHLEQAVAVFERKSDGGPLWVPCPYGMAGTPCWIKEAHTSELTYPGARPDSPNYGKRSPIYKADKLPHVAKLMKWREPYKMPRAYARTFVGLAEIGVERLQDITNVGAIDEGMLTLDDDWVSEHFPEYREAQIRWVKDRNPNSKPPLGPTPRARFERLITKLHKSTVWDENLWTWVLRLKRLTDYEQG